MKMPKRVFALLLAIVLVVGILPVAASAATPIVQPGSTITIKAGENYEAFAGSIPQHVVSCKACGADLYVTTPDSRTDYKNVSIRSSNEGIVSNLEVGWKNTTITSDPDHTYEAMTFKCTGARAGETTITVNYTINFNVPNLGNGYYECSDCGYPVVYYGDTKDYDFSRAFTVIVEETEVTYTLNYDGNGGNGAPAAQTATNNTGSATFTVSDTVPTREGYTFQGWADAQDATEAGYTAGNQITLTKDAPSKTIYAVWKAIPEYTYTLTYAPNGEGVTGMPENQTAASTAETYDFTVANVTPAREGFEFKGWADVATATTAVYAAGATITVNKEAPAKTIYAVWEKKNVKNSEPTMEKVANVSSLGRGQEVNFTLTSNVPDYLGDFLSYPTVPDPEIVTTTDTQRGKYDLKIHDEMDAGLIYKEGSLAVTVNEVTLTEGQYSKTITKNEDGTTSFLITMDLVRLCNEKVFTVQEIEKTPKIIVTYTASLDVTAGAGKYNNEAWTSYPAPVQTRAAEGEKESERSIVTLDVYGIQVFKYDQKGNTPLEGAEFRLLAADRTTVLAQNIRSGADGFLMFDGLAAGTYYVEETKAPEGYVKSDVALPVSLPEKANVTTNIASSQFANAQIPHTGGEGTARFLILGGTLMGMAVALYLVSQKKRSFQA